MVLPYINHLSALLQGFIFIPLGILGIGFLIGIHEFGHFLFAKIFNVRIPSFSIGFGPKLLSKKIGETEFSISAIPLGGYVEIAGAAEIGQGEQKEAHATDERSFAAKPFYQKLCIMLGGIAVNLLFAYIAITGLFITGIPKTPLISVPVISIIHAQSPADLYELKIGDRIIAINNEMVDNNMQRLQEIIQPLADKNALLTIERNGQTIYKSIVIGSKTTDINTAIGFLGVEFDITETPPHGLIQAIQKGISTTNQWIKNTLIGFTKIKQNKGQLAGPIMIIAMTTKAASAGLKIFILLLAIISINLAVLNILPLPILDGGQIFFYGIEALIRRPLPEKTREYIHIATWILFLILILYLSTKDIIRLAMPYIETLLQR